MESAVDVLARHARAISTHDPRIRLISNADGRIVHDGRDVLRRLVHQVAKPVRWDACQATMADLGVTALLEIPPAGTLTGLAKRSRHAPGVDSLSASPSWRLVVAPAKGIFTIADHIAPGTGVTTLPPGSAIGTVANLRESIDITAPHGGTIVEWVVEDGDPVSPGQPLLRLHPIISVEESPA
jgi:[acyl-carrier-protein] S-malonyltransferase